MCGYDLAGLAAGARCPECGSEGARAARGRWPGWLLLVHAIGMGAGSLLLASGLMAGSGLVFAVAARLGVDRLVEGLLSSVASVVAGVVILMVGAIGAQREARDCASWLGAMGASLGTVVVVIVVVALAMPG